ncbi:hypothetical protein Tco_0543493 [Tanacetum coccineum]
MSFTEIEQIVAQRVTDAIEAFAIYEMKIHMAHDSMDQAIHQETNVARNANNKRKWESNSRNNHVQQPSHKRQNMESPVIVETNEKKGIYWKFSLLQQKKGMLKSYPTASNVKTHGNSNADKDNADAEGDIFLPCLVKPKWTWTITPIELY